VPRSKAASGMQAHAGCSTFHFHAPQYKFIPAKTINSLHVLCSIFLGPNILMF